MAAMKTNVVITDNGLGKRFVGFLNGEEVISVSVGNFYGTGKQIKIGSSRTLPTDFEKAKGTIQAMKETMSEAEKELRKALDA